MQGTQVVYLGRSIAKESFRAFIYGADGSKRLVNSWDEFERFMASGVWFASAEEAKPKEQELAQEVVEEVQEEPKEIEAEQPKQEFKQKLEAHRKRGK